MYRKYYSYNDMPQPVYNQNKPIVQEKISSEQKNHTPLTESKKLFGKFEADDIILVSVIVMLLANDCNDKLLLLAIIFIFFNGFDGINL